MKDNSADATTANVIQSGTLPTDSWLIQLVPRSPFHIGAILAVIAALLTYFLLWRTVLGYRIRAVGQNARAATYAGMPVRRVMLIAMILSGGLAGLAGAVEVYGVTHRSLQDFGSGYGFSGIVVALFGGLHPVGAIPAAILFGGMLVSGTKLQSVGINSAMVTVLLGLIVLFVVSSSEIVRRVRLSAIQPFTPPKSTQPVIATPEGVS
jgi:simple sugar transport system permease protein